MDSYHRFVLYLFKYPPPFFLFVKMKLVFEPNTVTLWYSMSSFYSRMIRDHVDKYSFLLGPDYISAAMTIFISIL